MRNDIPYAELTSGTPATAGERIAYGPDSLQFGDLRLPPGRKKVPVVVLIHGGCWLAEFDLMHLSLAADALTAAGYATWTIEYRRVGNVGGGWPGTFVDVARGLDFTRELAKRIPRLDTTRVVVVGHSAGGQLALWTASRKPGDVIDDVQIATDPVRVVGVVSLAGITDMVTFASGTGSCNHAVTDVMGGTADEFPERYAAVNPIARSPLRATIQLIHGAADAIVPVTQSQSLMDRERANGGTITLRIIQLAGHFDLISPVSAAWPEVLRAVRSLATAK